MIDRSRSSTRAEFRRLNGWLAFAALALAGLSPSASLAAPAAEPEEAKPAEEAEEGPEVFKPQLTADATRVANWIAYSDDNGDLPYIIIDKRAAELFLFDAEGELIGQTPVLIGIAEGDEATPGVGSKKLSEIGPAERTTPAGRYLAKYGWAAGRQRVLWVDYATSVAIHAVVTGNRREQRLQRLLSPDAEDNRVTFGCINVPTSFYRKELRPRLEEEGGVVYVLPDSKPLEEVFPRLRVQPYVQSGLLQEL